jgi:hypothetical protein
VHNRLEGRKLGRTQLLHKSIWPVARDLKASPKSFSHAHQTSFMFPVTYIQHRLSTRETWSPSMPAVQKMKQPHVSVRETWSILSRPTMTVASATRKAGWNINDSRILENFALRLWLPSWHVRDRVLRIYERIRSCVIFFSILVAWRWHQQGNF